jgi:hypothetical protein
MVAAVGRRGMEPAERRPYCALCVMRIAVPVIVNVAVRAGPVLAATLNWTMPSPEPDAPWVTVRNAALLTAVHAQLEGVVTEMDVDPPAAGNAVVVIPVMIAQPGDVDEESLPPHAIATSSSAAEQMTRVRRERSWDRNRFMTFKGCTIRAERPDGL